MILYAVCEGITNYEYTYFLNKRNAITYFKKLKEECKKECKEKNLKMVDEGKYSFSVEYTYTDYTGIVKLIEIKTQDSNENTQWIWRDIRKVKNVEENNTLDVIISITLGLIIFTLLLLLLRCYFLLFMNGII